MKPRQNGFSLMEALVTLAIGSLLLSLLFSLTSQFVDQGFRLGNRALAQAERFPGRESLSVVLDSLVLPGGGFGLDGPESSFRGRGDGLSAMILAPRSTRCGPAGYRLISLSITTTEAGWSLDCSAQDEEPAVLASGSGAPPRFEYGNGDDWVETSEVLSPLDPRARTDPLAPTLQEPARLQLRIRLVDSQGRAIAAGLAERPRVIARPFNPAADE